MRTLSAALLIAAAAAISVRHRALTPAKFAASNAARVGMHSAHIAKALHHAPLSVPVVPNNNQQDFEYIGTIGVGTPLQDFEVIWDTVRADGALD